MLEKLDQNMSDFHTFGLDSGDRKKRKVLHLDLISSKLHDVLEMVAGPT